MGALLSTAKGRETPVESLGLVFQAMSAAVLTLNAEGRLVVELLTGEMADIMERMRYNLLDHRLSSTKNGSKPDPTLFPCKFDSVHMSNIPRDSFRDYIGGHLTTFLASRPLLEEDKLSSLHFNNLLNPPEFQDHNAFQSEYLLMYDMDRIRRHFLLARRPGEVTEEQLPPMFRGVISPFAFESYMVWDRVAQKKMAFQELMPKAEFEKWMYGHLLKICLPFPRPASSGSPVYAPLNLTTIIRLMIAMFEVGYPAHWLLGILSSMCSGVITTSARPPKKRVCDASDVDAKHPVQQSTIYAWVPELTTLVSLWHRLLPFGIDSLNASLVTLDNICQYSVAFPPFFAESNRYPHFTLLFWNTEVANAEGPPQGHYALFQDGEGGDCSTSAKAIRENGVVFVTAFRYHFRSRTASFWMRSDVVEKMRAGKWRAFIWRTDTWTSVTEGVDVSSGLVAGERWTGSM
ncbi:hypothetical protein E4U42_001857 [Claviceps africana]|uniref:Uncharacterized protein n=1 Tax=Claviceps africana TaxID=83212 RepID=A0A8K0JCU2_9HYPO|nr:hypothetical protein E4U42_001857 [Claviceps africana]